MNKLLTIFILTAFSAGLTMCSEEFQGQDELSIVLFKIVKNTTVNEDGKVSLVRACILAGANVNIEDKGGLTSLHWAGALNEEAIAIQLLEAGASVHAKDHSGRIPLHYSALYNAEKTTGQFFNAGTAINTKDEDGRTPLHYSTLNNAEQTTQQLLDMGANAHAKDKDGRTPLSFATSTEIKQSLTNAQEMQEIGAATKIQAVFRGYTIRKMYKKPVQLPAPVVSSRSCCQIS